MKFFTSLAFLAIFIVSCKDQNNETVSPLMVGKGQMPAIAVAPNGQLDLVFGNLDSIFYATSSDHGKSYSAPMLVGILPGLYASSMRGPQIARTSFGPGIIAATSSGDIYAYLLNSSGQWIKTARVNDADTVAKEGLMSLNGEGNNLYAVWLDLRNDQNNKIVGAGSSDGGKTWSRNKLIYTSPDASVCECCKPSVDLKGDQVFVMFRNWINGNRDLYLIHSTDGGNIFGTAAKLGNGHWPLNGCPMDGGGIAIGSNNAVYTVWRRQQLIYSAEPGEEEIPLGEGKSCSMDLMNDLPVYAWVEKGQVVCLLPGNNKKILGKGSLPLIKGISKNAVVCVWENEHMIYSAVYHL